MEDCKDKFKNPEFSFSDIEKREDTDFLFCLQWGAKGIGFGEFNFYYKDDKLCCDTEMMSGEFIKKAFCAMVDNCTLIDQ